MNKSDIYKTILYKIKSENINLEDILNKYIDHKYIYLELLMSPDLLVFFIQNNNDDLFSYYNLLYKFTTKYKITNNFILTKCLIDFKYKYLRSIILKILKYYDITDMSFIMKYNLYDKIFIQDNILIYNIFNKINTIDFKFVKKFILKTDKKYLPTEYSKIGYINLKGIRSSFNKNEIVNDINLLFVCKKFNIKFYEHKDEEVRIENFLNDPEGKLDIFLINNYLFDIHNIEYLINNISNNKVIDIKNICTIFINHNIDNIRYLGYSLINFFKIDININNLIFDKCKDIRNRFINLYKNINIDICDILNKKYDPETIIRYIRINNNLINIINKLINNIKINDKNDNSNINNLIRLKIDLNINNLNIKLYKNMISKKTLLYFYYKNKNIKKLVNKLIKEKDLGRIILISKYLKDLFIENDNFNYKKLLKRLFVEIEDSTLFVRRSGGLSCIFKCILENKKNRVENIKIIKDYIIDNTINNHNKIMNNNDKNIIYSNDCNNDKNYSLNNDNKIMNNNDINYDINYDYNNDSNNDINYDYNDNDNDKNYIKMNNYTFHIYNIFIEIYKKYKFINENDIIRHIFDNLHTKDFIIKNSLLRLFEIIYKKYDYLDNIEYINITDDDTLYVFLIMIEKYKNYDINLIKYTGSNIFIKMKLNKIFKIYY